jgi:alpha-ribazole phosphatase
MLIINLIRHGKTLGNLSSKMIGRTDEPLCGEGILEAREMIVPRADLWIISPMKRCVQTADILRDNTADTESPRIFERDFRECDFGHFENRNYIEMAEDEEYRAWIRSGGHMSFPGGEDPACFQERCCRAFSVILAACEGRPDKSMPQAAAIAKIRPKDQECFRVNMVVHGGTIMSIMDRFAASEGGRKRTYYDWAVPNLGGYVLLSDESQNIPEKLTVLTQDDKPVSPVKRKDTV